jgi:molecular chaperone DnaK (HSP70)
MSQIPCTKEQIFYTKISGQRQINLSITEGEYKELDYVTLIGEFMIDLPSGLPINTEVTIKIGLDERQLIHLSIAVPAVKLEKEFEMERNANLGEEELKKLQGIMSQKTVF